MSDPGQLPPPRRTALSDLQRLTGPFKVNGHEIGDGDRVSIATMAEGQTGFLDGNVYSAMVGLVPSRLMPYTGTRWQVRLNPGGTWSFLNQGHEEQMLAGSGGIATLGRPPLTSDATRFDTTHWLIYRDLTGFRLRPCMRTGGWLGLVEGRVVLCGPEEPVGRWIYWAISPFGVDE